MNFTEPVNSMYIHTVFYRKYTANVYRKFPIDLWEDICGWLNGTAKSWILDFSVGKILNQSNTNSINCPFLNHIYMKADNVPLESFTFDFLFPDGRFLAEIDFSNRKSGKSFAKAMLYFSVSDRRVEIF